MTHPPAADPRSLALLRRWAVLLDSAFRVPGTSIRFGLDAIVGLVPGIGDVSAPLFAGILIVTGVRMRVPAIVLARMLVNAALDAMIGLVPILGDLADVAWKANLRNLALLERYAQPGLPPRRSDYIVVIAFLSIAAVLAMTPILLLLWAISRFGLV